LPRRSTPGPYTTLFRSEIWEVEPERQGWKRTLAMRLEGLLILLGLGLAALVAVVANGAVGVVTRSFSGVLPGADWLWWSANQAVTLAVFTLVFAALFRFVPDVRLGWRDVWGGALFTAVLFKVGELGLGWYLGTAGVGSPYGAAGSLVVVLLFVYYAAQILLFGAEFTRADVGLRREARGDDEPVPLKRRAWWPRPQVRSRGGLERLWRRRWSPRRRRGARHGDRGHCAQRGKVADAGAQPPDQDLQDPHGDLGALVHEVEERSAREAPQPARHRGGDGGRARARVQ